MYWDFLLAGSGIEASLSNTIVFMNWLFLVVLLPGQIKTRIFSKDDT